MRRSGGGQRRVVARDSNVVVFAEDWAIACRLKPMNRCVIRVKEGQMMMRPSVYEVISLGI